MFWNADYGNLTFTSDHGLYTDCDGMGAGDAVLYPGGAPETGEQADKSFYPDAPRFNTTVRDCDMRGSVLAYSGSMGNAVRITHNNIYGNTAGISTDTISASGHPGFPADSVQIDHNWIYSNNLELYKPNAPVPPRVGILPVGVGIFWAGHNNGKVFGNWIWDNWRNAAFLLSIPDLLVTPEGNVNPGGSCNSTTLSTSCGNRFFDNDLGRVPKGFKSFPELYAFGNNVGATRGKAPNGVDFWWDEGGVGSVTGNCWFANRGPDGTAGERDRPGRRGRQRRAAVRLRDQHERGRPREGRLPAVLLPRPRGRGAARAVRLVHAAAEAGLLGGRGQAAALRARRARVPEDGAGQAAGGPDRRADGDTRLETVTLRAGILALVAALALASCGSGSDPPERAQPVGEKLVGSVAQMAQCSDWSTATRAQRVATIHDIRQQVNLKDGTVRTQALTDRAAYRVLQNICSKDFAGSFRLYKLYARAASFAEFAN